MLLCLGRRAHDVTTRALVMGALPLDEDLLAGAERLVADGADILAVAGTEPGRVGPAVAAVAARFDVAVAVSTPLAAVAAAALGAGACLALDPSGFSDPGYLPAVAAAGASVVAVHAGGTADAAAGLAGLGRAAEAAGVPPERVLVDAGADARPAAEAVALLGASGRLAALGWPLVLGVAPGDRAAGLSAAVLGVTLGCRVVRTADVRGARRVCDALAAVLEAA